MSQKFAEVFFCAGDVGGAIRRIEEENEGFDPIFALKMGAPGANALLFRIEDEIKEAMREAGFGVVKSYLKAIERDRKTNG